MPYTRDEKNMCETGAGWCRWIHEQTWHGHTWTYGTCMCKIVQTLLSLQWQWCKFVSAITWGFAASGGGRAAQEMRGSGKAIALKKNPHRERHHAMYCNVMFIWFSHRYSFTLKLQSEWTLLLELVRNLKGQKRKKNTYTANQGFHVFFLKPTWWTHLL
jgi:hypothetical protein